MKQRIEGDEKKVDSEGRAKEPSGTASSCFGWHEIRFLLLLLQRQREKRSRRERAREKKAKVSGAEREHDFSL